MTTRKSGSRRTKLFSATDRMRARRRRQDRKGLLETLEQRQLLAGPDLVAIQPNEGSLLYDGGLLTTQPRELVFQFDDATEIDPSTLSGIQITRAGGDGQFESAEATTDFGTNGAVLVDFRAVQAGAGGNGIQVNFTTANRVDTSLPVISVSGDTISVELNSNPGRATTVAGLITGLQNNAAASALVTAIRVSGATSARIGQTTPSGLQVTLGGANSASAVTDLGTGNAVRVRVLSALAGPEGRGQQLIVEQRNFLGPALPAVLVRGNNVTVQVNSAFGNETTVEQLVNAINSNPQASQLLTLELQAGSGTTKIGGISPSYSPLTLLGASDITVTPGYVGLGDSAREVVFRFAEPLPDDEYQISVFGEGPSALLNVDGEAYNDGQNSGLQFSLNLGPKVLAVVPEPVRRLANGSLSPEVGVIEVHFSDDDLNIALAQNPDFYQLYYSRGTASGNDDILVKPTSVSYDATTDIATLQFAQALARLPDPDNPGSFLDSGARLRIGQSEVGPNVANQLVPVEVAINPVEAGDSFGNAFDLDSQFNINGNGPQSAILSGEIFNTTPYGLDLPGGEGTPGVSNLRPDDPNRLDRVVPLGYLRNGGDRFDGISTVYYDFASSFIGDDPSRAGYNPITYQNNISAQQKERVREALSMFSEYLGIQFVETNGEPAGDAFFTIAVGDLYGGNPAANSGDGGLAVVTSDRNGDGVDDLAVLDFQDFDESTDDQYGGEFFRGAMLAVGQMLGYGYADDLPQPVTQSTNSIFNPSTDNESSYPSVADIVNGQYLYRPDSTDIDIYKFTLSRSGNISIQTIAERLPDSSLLDSTLRLYKRVGDTDRYEEVAANDDYFSNDSLIELELSPGEYMLGVSSSGNDEYDPHITESGFGGRTEGGYDLRIQFEANDTGVLRDSTGVALDGDSDGQPGGVHNFWFVPADPTTTLYVDKMASNSGSGSVGSPFQDLDDALRIAGPGDTVRVVANGGADGLVYTQEDNLSYQIGLNSFGGALDDGRDLNVPQGVNLVLDAGVIFKMQRSRVGVGSTSATIDYSGATLQLLGTPTLLDSAGRPVKDADGNLISGSVIFTSYNDDTVGSGNTPTFTPTAQAGDWGGIDFRGDIDAANETRYSPEDAGLFLNQIQFADLRYGGGQVTVDGRSVVVSPIDMAITRPTIANSMISNSADAAIAATPNTFEETRFDEGRYQEAGAFVPDYSRVGPDIYGNTVVDNSINGLFLRVVTRAGSTLEPLTVFARFDDTDIPHILTENLVIDGTPGGAFVDSTSPSALLVSVAPAVGTTVPAGTYAYRLTNVDSNGQESAPSARTSSVELLSTGAVQLTRLPAVPSGSDFQSRRLYRAVVTIDAVTGEEVTGPFELVAQLNGSSTAFLDANANPGVELVERTEAFGARLDARLDIDPGIVIKIDSARIEARFGADLFAEGEEGLPIVFTSLEDQRYGGGGTFDTNSRGVDFEITPGDWGGLYFGQGSMASLDHVVVAGAGGVTRIEGGFAAFNPIEVHQAELRLANSRFEFNADGQSDDDSDRVGRGSNAAGTVFVRAAAPIIVGNQFTDGAGAAISVDLNSLSFQTVADHGRMTGSLDRFDSVGNAGPLVRENRLDNNDINGMQVRGGELATQGVWDDYDIVHVVRDTIEVPNQFVYGGLQIRSDARGSLVAKFENDSEPAGIVVGGTLLTAEEQLRGIADRIGGSLQLIGHPDFPVVLTTLADDFSGAGFTPSGAPQLDTNNDGLLGGDLTGEGEASRLPTGPEVNNGLLIDNDVNQATPGFFSGTPGAGNSISFLNTGSGVTVLDTNQQLLIDQNYIFEYSTYVIVGTTATELSQSTITQQPTLVSDDRVESRGTFAGPNGLVNWTATTYFLDGIPTMYSSLDLEAASGSLGDIQIVSYLDEDVDAPNDDIMYTSGTPGQADFRAYTIDGARRIGFAHGGFYTEDGVNQTSATYDGWAADIFNELQLAIQAGTQTYTVAGNIDLTDLPAGIDAGLGAIYGPADVTTAFAWSTDPVSASSRITSFLELIPQDPTTGSILSQVTPGLWNGITVREAASDRNVAAVAENESVMAISPGTNSIAGQAQYLGELAPSVSAGDENRRIGYVIDGVVAQRDDVDVYSFVAEAGTEVWFDIDRTANSLDAVLELIDANGNILALSNDSLAEERDPSLLYTGSGLDSDAVRPMSEVGERTETQILTISGNIADADGFLIIGLTGVATEAVVAVEDFLVNPAGSVQAAINAVMSGQLGAVDVTLARREARQLDPVDPNIVLKEGGDYVLEVRFNNDLYLGSDVPNLIPDTGNLIITGGAVVTGTLAEVIDDDALQDLYSTNSRDPGMRVVLPGETGARNLYHIRVRSAHPDVTLRKPDSLILEEGATRNGLTSGNYQLQVRLQETDEAPGTQVRFTDIRYATTGLQIIGQPFHSPLIGEEYEQSAANDAFAQAQPLGPYGVGSDANLTQDTGPLSSDVLAKTIAGVLDSEDDIDWYQFNINYERLTRDSADLYLATIFDLDYADKYARADMAFYVFNEAGQLIMTAGDSNIADDQPRADQGADSTDLSRGSAGTLDPYLGTTELSEGRYFVAVANQSRIPEQLNQFYAAGASNPLLRLEPIDSIVRIAEDRIGSSGGGTAADPVVPVLFDPVTSPIDYTLNDVILYTIGNDGLGQTVNLTNPFTGESYSGDLGTSGLGRMGADIVDFEYRANGELFGFNRDYFSPTDDGISYYRINSSNGAITAVNVSNIETFQAAIDANGVVTVVPSDTGVHPEAITFMPGVAGTSQQERGFFVGNRVTSTPQIAGRPSYLSNILYMFDPDTGEVLSGAAGDRVPITVGQVTIDPRANGAGTQVRERGYIETNLVDTFGNIQNPGTAVRTQFVVTGATQVNANGQTTALIRDGLAAGGPTTFTITATDLSQYTFEFDSGPTFQFQYDDELGVSVRDGDQITVTSISGPKVYEVNTGPVLTVDPTLIVDGDSIQLTDNSGLVRTFEFNRVGGVTSGSIAVPMRDVNGNLLTADELLVSLRDTITRADFSVIADATFANGRISLSNDSLTVLPVVNGTGLGVEGDYAVTPGLENNQILVEESATATQFARALTNAIGDGVVVSSAGNRLNFRGATSVDVTSLQIRGVIVNQTGQSGVEGIGNISVPFSVSDRDEDIAVRIVQAINDAGLGTITASANGRTVSLVDAAVTRNSVGPAFEVTNVTPGGLITGLSSIGSDLYAVSNAGGLYLVDNPTAAVQGNIGTYVGTATDLVGLQFTGLTTGPQNVDGGQYADLLFGTTANGRLYAFNTAGVLQPVFAGGQTSTAIGQGISARGLAFSTLDQNLWHVTENRDEDAGHGINENFSGTRGASIGGNSLYFGYEEGATAGGGTPSLPRLDGQSLTDTYNFPGGAQGALESNPFSLVGYSSEDQPFLYFNYFLESDDAQDAFRVYVITDDGSEELVATNASIREPGSFDDEYDDSNPFDDIDIDVQELHDNSNSWRQARVSLGEFAGLDNLRLRVEFSTSGQVGGGDASIRTLPGTELRDGQSFVIGNQEFSLDFGPTIVTVPGSELAAFYTAADAGVAGSAPDTRVTVSVGGITFVLNDGLRNVDPLSGEVDVLLVDSSIPGAAPLSQLTAAQISVALADAIAANQPTAVVDNAYDFTDEPNNELATASQLTVPQGDISISGIGQIDDVRDVDLIRIDLPAGATLDASTSPTLGSTVTPLARLFDAAGNEVARGGSLGLQVTAVGETTYYLGVSSSLNTAYNPNVAGSGSDGDIGSYTTSISITRDFRVLQDDNRIEITGGYTVSLPNGSPLAIDQSLNSTGIPVQVDSGMTAAEIAVAVRNSLANQFSNGQLTGYGSNGSLVNLVNLTVQDAGPFGQSGTRYGDLFGDEGAARAADNDHEGVYIDDIIIGFAERGELATGASTLQDLGSATDFIVDPSPNLTLPAQPTSNLVTGSYQLEIRDASEYVASSTGVSAAGSTFRAFDTNTRLANSQTITARPATELVDGSTFTIGDGTSTVTFEFDFVDSATRVQPGNVAIPYSFEVIEPGSESIDPFSGLPIPGTGVVRPQTASEVAATILNAINSAAVQSVLDVSAQPASGVDTLADIRINLLGTSLVDNSDGALAEVVRLGARGDENRDREAQGVILVENSRFLFNSQYGIDLVHDVTADVAGVTTDSLVRYPRNLVELNSEALVPGVVVQSNVMAFNSVGGIRVSGLGASGTDLDPVPFDRIVNNTIIGGTVSAGVTAAAETYHGFTFSQGALSFADRVVDYNPIANGGPAPDIEFQDTDTALGIPDCNGRGPEPANGDATVSLGNGGTMTVEFVDNRLTGSGDSRPDLVVFETGAVESVLVEVSRDGVTFFEVGIVDGLSMEIDIDAAGFGPQDRLAFVRLTDLRQGDPTALNIGADIDAVGALFSTSVDLFVSGGTGITVRQNASPTLLNNVVSNSELGVDIDASSVGSVMGALTLYRNTTNVSGTTSLGTFSQVVGDSEELFVSPGELIFTPSSGSSLIDSSIDSLQDRASLVTVRNPLGLPPSPILAPRLDVNGQLRVDDPTVESPFGSGELVFKDRGAEDRGDQTGPRAILISPRADELGLSAGVGEITGKAPEFFEIQLVDGIAPTDPTPGVGVDDRSVSGNSLLLLENGQPLIEGVDYTFGYNPSTNTIRLTPLAGVFKTDSVYVVRMLDSTDSVILALEGNRLTDGGIYTVVDRTGQRLSFEYETGITVTIPQTLPEVVGADGASFTVTDGQFLFTFELDDDGQTTAGSIPVQLGFNASIEDIATAMVNAINGTALNVTAVDVGEGKLGIVGSNSLTAFDPLTSGMGVAGSVGTEVGFGISVPANVAIADGLEAGQTFVINRGSVQQVQFEITTTTQVTNPGAVAVTVAANATVNDVADALVRAIAGSGLGLSPVNAGGGRVSLGGDVNYSLDMSDTVLQQLGNPGQTASIPVVISPAATDVQAATAIVNAINGSAAVGVTASQVGPRVFVDGSTDVTGTGVLDLVTIQDEVGNLLQSNQANGNTELTIFVGTGFDYGDAPGYGSTFDEGGPRRKVDEGLRLGNIVTADSDAKLPDADDDDGVSLNGTLQSGFTSTLEVLVNTDGRAYTLDVMVDWNADGDFDDASERVVTGLAGNTSGARSLVVTVPNNGVVQGTTYARVILSDQNGEVGEIEDLQVTIGGNPYQNPNVTSTGESLVADVNDSGFVSPLDALQIINVLNQGGGSVSLQPPPAGLSLPPYPDVNGDGFVTPIDALEVINALNRLSGARGASGEEVSSAYVPSSDGVLASVSTAYAQPQGESVADPVSDSVETFATTEKVTGRDSSVFDAAAEIEVEDILDSIASDRAVSDSEAASHDDFFSQLGS